MLLQVQQRIQKYLKDCERDQELGHVKILTNVGGYTTYVPFVVVRICISSIGCIHYIIHFTKKPSF